MHVVTGLPPAGLGDYDAVLVLVFRPTRKEKFFPTLKEISAMETATLLWNRVIADVGLFRVAISDRDPRFTAEVYKALFKIMGPTLEFSTAYHPQTDGLAERTMQTLEDMIRRYCAFGIE